MAAKVILVGAGPGNPNLITVGGLEAIKKADVVVYDYLSNNELLSNARDDAKVVYVGKKGFDKHITQDEINEVLVSEALGDADSPEQSDITVVRLKGGDPFVFGRGGEEALALAEAGIEFEVIPGVTSGIAAPASAGIPVTHRGISASVAFITGNEDPTKPETDIDWDRVANGAQTLCFYMGVRNLRKIASKLMEAGRAPGTPVALIRWGTLPCQEELYATLEDVADKAEAANFCAPAIILVGEVAGLHNALEGSMNVKLPLAGRTIAITRSRTQASALRERVKSLGANAVELPTIRIEELDDFSEADAAARALANGSYDWVVFTSVNGVEAFYARVYALGLDSRAFAGAKVAVIGSATAASLKEYGIIADFVPPEYRAESVAYGMLDAGVGGGSRVLIARAQEARDMLPKMLEEAGASVDVVPVYRTVLEDGETVQLAIDDIRKGKIDSITFTSSSTVRNFVKLLGEDAPSILPNLKCYSIGPITSETLESLGGKVAAEASPYTIEGLVKAILEG